jgi:hypothetical protein
MGMADIGEEANIGKPLDETFGEPVAVIDNTLVGIGNFDETHEDITKPKSINPTNSKVNIRWKCLIRDNKGTIAASYSQNILIIHSTGSLTSAQSRLAYIRP